MKFFYLFVVGLLVASLLSSFAATAQISAQTVPCPPIGIRTDPRYANNPGGQPNTFNWYYGNYQPSVYNGEMYTLNSPLPSANPYINLP